MAATITQLIDRGDESADESVDTETKSDTKDEKEGKGSPPIDSKDVEQLKIYFNSGSTLFESGVSETKKKRGFKEITIYPFFSNTELLARQIALEFKSKLSLIIIKRNGVNIFQSAQAIEKKGKKGKVPDVKIEEPAVSEYEIQSFEKDVFPLDLDKIEASYSRLKSKYSFKDEEYPALWIYYNNNFRHNNVFEPYSESAYKTKGHYTTITTTYATIFVKMGIYDPISYVQNIKTRTETMEKEIFEETRTIRAELANIKKMSEEKSLPASNLMITKKTIDVSVKYFDDTLSDMYELFDRFRTTDQIPFMKIEHYYKVLKNSDPLLDWKNIDAIDLKNIEDEQNVVDATTTSIYLKVLNIINIPDALMSDAMDKKGKTAKKDKMYSTVKLTKYKDKPDLLFIRTEIGETRGKLDIKQLAKRLLFSLPETKVCKNSEKDDILETLIYVETGIEAEFQIPKLQLFDVSIRHICMLDPAFSYFLSIDERTQTFKKKKNIYVHFNFNSYDTYTNKPAIFGSVVASIGNEIVRPNDGHLLNTGLFKEGELYLNVHISRAGNRMIAEKFKNAMRKLMAYYKRNANVTKFYSEIPNFKQLYLTEISIKDTGKKVRRMMLKDIAPHIFLPGYERHCQKQWGPTNIQEDEANKLIASGEGYRVMKFPENKDGLFYACVGKSYPYIQLKPNTLANKEEYPYLPCCFGTKKQFKQDHKEKRSVATVRKTLGFIDKPLERGSLPININSILMTLDKNKNTYERCYVKIDPSSILYALGTAMKDNIDDDNYIENKRNEMLQLLEEDRFNIWQEAYGKTAMSIENLLKNPLEYLDLKLFIRELEIMYKCKIMIFSRNAANPDGYLTAPNFYKRYYSTTYIPAKDVPTILIYQHLGSEANGAKYPHNELIARGDKKAFDSTTLFSRRLFSFYKDLYVGKNIEREDEIVDNFDLKIDFRSTISAQLLDVYDKCRYLELKFGKQKIVIETNPLPAFPVSRSLMYKPVKYSTAQAFLIFERLEEVKEAGLMSDNRFRFVYIGNKRIGIKGRKGNVHFYIPLEVSVTGVSSDSTMITSPSFIHPYNEKSILENYNHLKRMARYIVEYFFMDFSIFYKSNTELPNKSFIADLEAISLIKEYVKHRIEIDEKVKYPSVFPRVFLLTIFENGKITLKNKETLSRLIYVLRLELKNNFEGIINYHKQLYINNYYRDVSDFDKKDHVISGDYQYERLITRNQVNYNATDIIIPVNITTKESKLLEIKETVKNADGSEYTRVTKETMIDKQIRISRISAKRHIESPPVIYSNKYVTHELSGSLVALEHSRLPKSGMSNIFLKKYILQPVSTRVHAYNCCKIWKEKGFNIGNIQLDDIADFMTVAESIKRAADTVDLFIEYYAIHTKLVDFHKSEKSDRVIRELKRWKDQKLLLEPVVDMNTFFYRKQTDVEMINRADNDYACIFYKKESHTNMFYFALLPLPVYSPF